MFFSILVKYFLLSVEEKILYYFRSYVRIKIIHVSMQLNVSLLQEGL